MTNPKNKFAWDDWFGRSEDDHYTFRDNTNKAFNWERGYSNYSNFFMRDTTNIREAARLVGSMLSVVGLERKSNMTSSLIKAVESGDQVPVILPSDILDNKKYKESSNAERTDAFLGGSVRNAASNVFNNTSQVRKLNECRYRLRSSSKEDTKAYPIIERLQDMYSIALNDERTDRKVAEEFPGYTNFIGKYKEFKFKHNYEPQQYENDYQEFADVLLRMIQFPGTIEPELIDKYKSYLKDIQQMMDENGGIPETHRKCETLAQQLAQYVYRLIVDPPTPPDGGGGSGEGEGEGGSGAPGNGGTPPPPMSKAEQEQMMESLRKMIEGNGVQMTSDADGNDEDRTMDQILDELAGMGMYDEMEYPENIVVKMMKGDRREYEKVLKSLDVVKASVIGTLLRRKARDFKFAIKSTRSGRLDTNKLVEAKMRVPTVYERIGEVKTDKLAVCVLIDESGSMSGRNKIDRAQEAAIFLNEALKKQSDIQLFIYGHTADHNNGGETNIQVYREPGHYAPYALSDVRARSNNRDGTAILTCAKRVRKFTQDPVVFVVISDGYPAASGYRSYEHGIEHTAKAVKRVESTLNMQVIQIAIESMDSSKMFRHFIALTDMKTFPTEFVGFLRKKMNSMIKEHITL